MTIDDEVRHELKEVVKEAIVEASKNTCLSAEEVSWVKLAIKAEVERSQLRRAIIEKTLTGLVWTAISGSAVYAVHFIQNHFHFK